MHMQVGASKDDTKLAGKKTFTVIENMVKEFSTGKK